MELKLTKKFGWSSKLHIYFMALVICLSISVESVTAQNNTITGRVIDGVNQELIGATIIEKGTTNGTSTGIGGGFSINANVGSTLVVSYLGYISKEVVVGAQTDIDIILQPDAQAIEAVVTIGYGSQRKEDLSMSVSTLKVDDQMKGRPQDLATILQGRIPGMSIARSGDPMTKSSFSIRGRGSKGADDDQTSGDGVLFVVDGVPNAPYMVSDIETITVLKDAASAAIYGASVGSSGVILITTRKAQSGAVKVTANVSIGLQNVTNMPSLLTAPQLNEVWAKAVSNDPNGKLPTAYDPNEYAWGNVQRTNWLDEIYRTGLTQHYSVSISGGSEKLQSMLSLSYDNNEGVLLNTHSNAFNGKLQTTYNVTDWLKITERVSFSRTDGQGRVNTSHEGPIMGAVWYPSSASVYEMNKDGSYALDKNNNKVFGGTAPRWASASGHPKIFNPVADLTRMQQNNPETKIFSTTSLEIKPISSITIKSDFTADMLTAETDSFNAKMTEPGNIRAENKRYQRFYDNSHWLWETTASWAELFDGHHISAMLGYTMDYKKHQSRSINTMNYPVENINNLTWDSAGSLNGKPRESIYEYSMLSALARVGYSYNDRYFFVASLRRDASSKLPISNNADYFPAVSGSWKVSSEDFFKNSSLTRFVDLFKFRGSWGKVGNVDLYDASATNIPITTITWPIILGENLDNEMYGQYLGTIPNPNARWEVTEQSGAGLDLSLFSNKLDVTVDYYYKATKDLVDNIPIPSSFGIPNEPLGNLGKVINRGFEVSVNYNGSAKNLTYNIWGMFSTNKGWVKEYGDLESPMEHKNPNVNSNALLYSYPGQPWHSFRLHKTDGIFRTQADIDNHTHNGSLIQPNAKLGDLIFVDSNGDGKITADDREFMGSYSPINTFSLGASVNWNGFDFSLMIQGVSGNKVYNGLKQMAMNGRDQGGNLVTDVLDTWDFNPMGSEYPRLGISNDSNGNYSKFSDIFLENGDYLRLKNVTLGYTLPSNLSRIVGISNGSIRVYASMDNALTITGYSGVDPEVGNYGVDRGVYPLTHLYNFGINISF